jgi:hypothetical protein
VAALCVLPQLLVWRALYGHLYVVPQGAGFMRWDAPAWTEVLFASRNGLIPWAPIYAVAGLGLIVALVGRARLAGLLLVGVALQAIVNGAAWDWWGGGAFGGRRFDSCYAAFAIGLGALIAPGCHALATLAHRPRWPRALLAIATAPVIALGLALAIANVGMAIHYDSTLARIGGGDRAANVFRIHLKQGVRKRAGTVAATASSWASWPARALFAWRRGVPLDTYDRVVGVHFLGETFPGLNSVPPPRDDRRDVGALPRPFRYGLVPTRGRPGAMSLAWPRATLLIPLNRTGGVRFTLRARHAVPGRARVWWNGALVADAAVGPGEAAITWSTFELIRGVNELQIAGDLGLELSRLELAALDR